MDSRRFSPLDRILGEIDRAIKVLWSSPRPLRATPAAASGEPVLDGPARRDSSRLMRVNHAGEVAAQALYRGQALTARDPVVAEGMRQAAAEEVDHLAWCEQRLEELEGRTSRLNPLWYAGSFAIGAVAGMLGDRTSLGFISETEKQVESHLRGHLERLPAADTRSRAILLQMTRDEMKHGAAAAALGGNALPFPLRKAMRLTARLMTVSSYWL